MRNLEYWVLKHAMNRSMRIYDKDKTVRSAGKDKELIYSIKSTGNLFRKNAYLDLHFMTCTTFQIYKILEENKAIYFYSHEDL